MYYCKKYNLGFFHIPKTGGTSFRKFLKRRANFSNIRATNKKHEQLLLTINKMGIKKFNNINVITIIRNPYAVVVSLKYYAINNRLSNLKKGEKLPKWLEPYTRSFEEYVNWYVENKNSYSDYLLVNNKLPSNVHIVKLETLKKDVNRILNIDLKLNLKLNIPHLRKTKHLPFMEYYNKNSLNKITEKYKWTFDNNFYNIGKV